MIKITSKPAPSFGLNWRNHHVNSATGGSAGTPTINNNCKLNHDTSLTSSSSDDDENEFIEKRSRLKKCSSLKTSKATSENTSNVKISKKIVRFADVLGLDLERVKTFMDEIPRVPMSAFKDLTLASESNNTFSSSQLVHNSTQSQQIKPSNPIEDRIILPNFHQPFTQANFYQQLHEKRVMLETAYSDNSSYIIGTVRVVNVGFEKTVYIRYSQDDWLSWQEIEATYNSACHDVTTDKFNFTLYMNNRLSFAVRYVCNGQEFWDSNSGANYSFNSIPNAVPSYNHVYNQVHW
ncbi:unnamed protein product [Allacma fusca]|uniref:CBM21 domain-containing protein n=1 Tax=Allacma fusca TaxID=39272 RepID=A0A8J2KIL5_9HEXA|nr:unnamed protein product [Allacma fusca]